MIRQELMATFSYNKDKSIRRGITIADTWFKVANENKVG